MKNETTRTKTLSGFSSRAIALVLCFVMLLTAIGSGSVLSAIAADFEGNGAAVLVDAAKAGADVDAPAVGEAEESSDILAPEDIDDGYTLTKKGAADIADTGRDADLAATGTDYYLWYDTDDNITDTSYSSQSVSVSGTVYTASFTFANTGTNIYFTISSSFDKANAYNNSVFDSSTTYSSSGNLSSIGLQEHGGKYSIRTSLSSANQTIYVTYDSSANDVTVSTTAPSGGGSGGGSGLTTASKGTIPARVLKGYDLMFYICSYNSGSAGLTSSSKGTPSSTASSKDDTSSGKVFYSKSDVTNHNGEAYVQITPSLLSEYNRITNNIGGWEGNVHSSLTSSLSQGGGNYWANSSTGSGNATSCTTTLSSASVVQGGTVNFVTTCGNTVMAYDNDGDLYYQYYIDDSNTTPVAIDTGDAIKGSTSAQSFTLSSSVTSNLTTGTHTLYTVVTNGHIWYISDTDTFTVSAPTYYDVTVKSNNARLGTGTASPASAYAGQTVTINISENMGSISTVTATDASNNSVTVSGSDTTRTFTMPSSAVTVNLTFTDYTAASNFYYNSYETNGNESSTRYGQQMTEGKINGQTFSYYHVEGRTGTDQLFTVSYGSPKYNSYNTYFSIYTGWENGGVSAQFYATDGNNLGDYANMTFDSWDSTDKKKFRIGIPDGARSVRFKNNNGGATTGELSLASGNNAWYVSGDNLDSLTAYPQSNPVPVNFYENFNGEGKYTANFSTNGFYGHNSTRGASHAYTKPKDLGTDSGDYYIIVLYKGKTYTINGDTHTVDKDPEIIWMPKLPGTEDIDSSEVNVYGKDGTIVIDWNNKSASGATGTSGAAYGYSLIADTKLYDSDGTTAIGTDVDDDGASYEKAKVVVTSEDSANIVVKTTIASDYRSKYYLKGWNINGVTYACGTNVKGVNAEGAGSNGEYTMKYTIPAGTEDSSSIEITPIYYLKSDFKTDNGITTVTFYLEGYNTITEKWGDTPYIYPFYGNLNNVDNSFGVYPGQPMVFAAGQYSVEVPVNKNVPIAKEPGETVVKGITINNGYADHVHRNLVYKWSDHDNDQEHKQTYDYDDFYKIYEECLTNAAGESAGHPNAIFFRIKDEETVFNRAQYGGGKSGQFASGTSNININTIATSGNGWELLTNRYDQAINLFGDHVSDPTTETATTDTANALYIVSTGYNANIAGDYGTMWKIYNGSGQLISNAGGRVGVPPSVLLLRGNANDGYTTDITYPSADRSVDGVGSYTDSINDYAAIYKALHDSSYTSKRVYITYEKDAQDTRKVTSGTGANRLDGRWFYTHSSDKVQSKIGIEYWDNAQNKWVTDTMNGITGSHTTCTAKFTDSNATTSNQYLISSGITYNFTAEAKTGWKFDSWQIKYSETSYDPIGTTETASVPATASYEIVARFVPTTSGDLTINHTLNKASSGEGTVDMEVKVYTDSTKGTLVTDGSKTGSRVYLGDTFINNTSASNYVIEIKLKTTPIYDGTVSQFTYDKFNTDNNITATTVPAPLPGSENTLTTSTFTIPVSSLYNVGTLKTRELNYTSLIDETLHYYNFTYSFTDRSGVSKTYTSKGVMGKDEYAKIVSDQAAHTLDPGILVDKAPFESNFLKSNTLTKGTIAYASGTHTYTATSTFSQSDNVPTYHVVFKLPYSYYNTAGTSDGGINYKKYTASSTTYNPDADTFDLAAKYNTFVTVKATSAAPDTAQTNVDKVTDGSDINHTGNNFITAPDELIKDSTTMYFKYWDIKKLKSDGSAGDDVAKIYYPDFHYRVYSDYYVTAVYSSAATDSWKLNYSEENNNDIDCSVLYLGDSRNQWNDANKASSTDAADAADLIYSDFIFHYTYEGQEIKNNSDLEVGMILERATYKDTSDGNTVKWLTGSTSVNDMSYYRANYGGTGDKSTETARKRAILSALNSSAALPSGTIKAAWDRSELNNKNFTEQSYKAYSQYGQTVANDTITFAQDSVIDNYVYRAYAYIKDNNGYTLSDPVYFSMRYTSNLKYTE